MQRSVTRTRPMPSATACSIAPTESSSTVVPCETRTWSPNLRSWTPARTKAPGQRSLPRRALRAHGNEKGTKSADSGTPSRKRPRESPQERRSRPGPYLGYPPNGAAATLAFDSPAPASGSEKVASRLFLISLPPSADGEPWFRFTLQTEVRFNTRKEASQRHHHTDERSASLESRFSFLWDPCSPWLEYAPSQQKDLYSDHRAARCLAAR